MKEASGEHRREDDEGRVFRLAVLASGSGTNLQAIIDRLHGRRAKGAAGVVGGGGADDAEGPLIEVALVVSDQPGARALERAKKAGIRTAVCPLDPGDRKGQEKAVLEAVSAAAPDLVVLAGYMLVVPAGFVRAFPWRVINLHPALLPAFPGTTSIDDALRHGVKVTGVTVHFVDEGLDTGPIIAQRAVEIEEGDTTETLAERIHAVEHELLPATIRLFSLGKVNPPLPGTRVVQVHWDEGLGPAG